MVFKRLARNHSHLSLCVCFIHVLFVFSRPCPVLFSGQSPRKHICIHSLGHNYIIKVLMIPVPFIHVMGLVCPESPKRAHKTCRLYKASINCHDDKPARSHYRISSIHYEACIVYAIIFHPLSLCRVGPGDRAGCDCYIGIYIYIYICVRRLKRS